MDEKRSRSKRSKISEAEGFWDCSVCTFTNRPEAFKCDMCDVRKGTSTRKPQINAQLVAQQVATQQFALPPLKKEKKKTPTSSSSSTSPPAQILPSPNPSPSSSSSGKKAAKLKEIKASSTPASSKPKRPARLKNIDRSTAFSMEVTVNDVTVIITDYKPKKEKDKKDKGDTPGAGSSALSSPTLSPSASSSVASLSPSPSLTSSSSVLSPVTSSMTSSAADNQNNNVTGLPTSSDSPRGSSAYSVDNLLNSSNSSSTGASSSAEYNKANDDVEMKESHRD